MNDLDSLRQEAERLKNTIRVSTPSLLLLLLLCVLVGESEPVCILSSSPQYKLLSPRSPFYNFHRSTYSSRLLHVSVLM